MRAKCAREAGLAHDHPGCERLACLSSSISFSSSIVVGSIQIHLSLSLHRLLPLESDPDREGRTKEERQPAVKTSTRSNQTPCFKERRSKLRIIIVDEAICDKRELCFLLLLLQSSRLRILCHASSLFSQSHSRSLDRGLVPNSFLAPFLASLLPSFSLSTTPGGAAFP